MIKFYRITACSDPDDIAQTGYGLRFESQVNNTVFVTKWTPKREIIRNLEKLDNLEYDGDNHEITVKLEGILGGDWKYNGSGMEEYTMHEIPLRRSEIPDDLNPHYI